MPVDDQDGSVAGGNHAQSMLCRAVSRLDELFDDLAMQLVMRRDGVTERDLRVLLCELKDIRAAPLVGIKPKPFTDTSRPCTGWRRDAQPGGGQAPIRFI